MNTTKDVRDFMIACSQEIPENIYCENHKKNTRLYSRLIIEEVFELMETIISPEKNSNLILAKMREELTSLCDDANRILTNEEKIQIADDLGDIVYVSHGLANAIGIDLELVKSEIHRSNLSKLNPDTGLADLDANNKVIKGKGYFKPDLKGVLGL